MFDDVTISYQRKDRKCTTHVEGNLSEILGAYAILTNAVYEEVKGKIGKERAKEAMDENYIMAFMDPEQLLDKLMQEIKEKLFKGDKDNGSAE